MNKENSSDKGRPGGGNAVDPASHPCFNTPVLNLSSRNGVIVSRLRMVFCATLALLPLPASATEDGFRFTLGGLPENVNPAYGGQIDYLYSIIFVIVFVIFLITEGALLGFLFRYRRKDGQGAYYTHGNTTVEIVWSVIPAVILVWLAFYQKGTWDDIKTRIPPLDESVVVQAFPEQFSWNFRYPGPDGKFGTSDDVMTINDLRVPVNRPIVVFLSAKDVLHSFFVPHPRVKQDAVPGMRVRAWFRTDRIAVWNQSTGKAEFLTPEEYEKRLVALEGFYQASEVTGKSGKKRFTYEPLPTEGKILISDRGRVRPGTREEVDAVLHHFEIVCAELCGLGHYRMRAFLTVDTQEGFDRWMARQVKEGMRAGEAKWTQVWDKYFPHFNEL